MTNKTKTILCVCALTASAFAWNATADESDLPSHLIIPDGGGSGVDQLVILPEGAYGIYNEPYGTPLEGKYWSNEYNGVTLNDHYQIHEAQGAWDIVSDGETNPPRVTMFKSVTEKSVLSIGVERNNNANAFDFGTFTYDSEGHPTNLQWLGTVGEVEGNKEAITAAEGVKKLDNGNVTSAVFDYRDNELVGIWIQEVGSNAIYYSDNNFNPEGQYTTGYIQRVPSDPNDPNSPAIEDGYASVWFDIDNQGNWPGQDSAGVNGPADIKFRLTGVGFGDASDPKQGPRGGQPLPGVWATIALAGAASAYLKRRRKENK